MMRILWSVIALVTSGLPSVSFAQVVDNGAVNQPPYSQSRDLALAGGRSWDAMTCSAYAENMGNPVEQQRLYDLAISEGRRFASGVVDHRVSKVDIDNSVPLAELLVFQGPSVDFILGRVWETAMRNAWDKISHKRNDDHAIEQETDKAVLKINAEKLYLDSHCQSLR